MNMPLSVLNRRRRIGAASTPAFSPSALFALAEPGVWYDPSDLSTLFTDTAGTTPVTTPGNTVALMLDKSKGLTLGTELVTNGDFASGITGWVSQNSSNTAISWDTGELKAITSNPNGGLVYQNISTVAGQTYKVTADVRAVAGNVFCYIWSQGIATLLQTATAVAPTTTRAMSFVFTAVGTTTVVSFVSSQATTWYLDNVTTKLLSGNHATQATAASRPTYGVVPLGGRRNLLTWSEDFRDTTAAGSTRPWVFTGASVSANVTATTDPVGGNTADKFIENAAAGVKSVRQGSLTTTASTYSFSCYLKAAERNWVLFNVDTPSGGNGYAEVYVNLTTGAFGTQAAGNGYAIVSKSIADAGNGWWRVSLTYSATAMTTAGVQLFLAASNGTTLYTGDGTSGVYIWGAQLELGSTATAYQKVTTQYDVTEAGVQSLSYLSFDGVDDFMLTGTITPGVDKAQIFAGVRRLTDAEMTIVESSVTWWNNLGTFAVSTLATPYFSYSPSLRGTASAYYTAGVDAAPNTRVITGLFDIAGTTSSTEVSMRSNGVLKSLTSVSGTDSGTGNLLAYPLYIGRRGSGVLPLNGQIYSLITRFGANLDTTAITNTETWVNGKTGAYA